MGAIVRYTVHFSGSVQGVGFRYTTVSIAKDYAVSGYVQNLADGRVRLVAEGKPDQLDRFIAQIQQRMGRLIQTHHTDRSEATGAFGQPGVDALTVRY